MKRSLYAAGLAAVLIVVGLVGLKRQREYREEVGAFEAVDRLPNVTITMPPRPLAEDDDGDDLAPVRPSPRPTPAVGWKPPRPGPRPQVVRQADVCAELACRKLCIVVPVRSARSGTPATWSYCTGLEYPPASPPAGWIR